MRSSLGRAHRGTRERPVRSLASLTRTTEGPWCTKSLVEVSALCLLMSIAARSAVDDSPAWRQSRSTGRSDSSVPSVVPSRSCRSSVRFSPRPPGRASLPAPARSHQRGDGGRRIGRLSLKPETAHEKGATPALSIQLRFRWHGSITEPHIQPRPIGRDQDLDQA